MDKKEKHKGSVPLKNQKHEDFCWGIVLGKSKAKAYRDAGYEPTSAKQNGSRLMMTNEYVKERIEYLRWQHNILNEISHERIAEEYRRLAFSRIDDYVEDAEDHIFIKKIKDIKKSKLSAVRSFKTRKTIKKTKDAEEISYDTEIKLYDKQGSLMRLESLTGLTSDFGKVRSGLAKYGKDIRIDEETNQWELIDVDVDV